MISTPQRRQIAISSCNSSAGLARDTLILTAKGAERAPVVSDLRCSVALMRSSHASSPLFCQALCVGKQPMTPARQHASTNAGVDAIDIGAAIRGKRSRLNTSLRGLFIGPEG